MEFLLGVAVTLALVILLLLLLLKLGLFALLFTKTGAIEHTKERILSEAPKYVLNEVSKIAKEKNFEETIKNKTGSIFDRVTESLALFDIKSLFKPKSEQKKPVMNTHVSETWAPSKTDETNLDVKNSLETTDIKGTEQTTHCHPSEKSTTASEWYEQEVKILGENGKRSEHEKIFLLTILAMASNREDFLDELMRRHISYINYKDKNNGTLMHIAATGGHVAAMEWLKKYGANIDIDAKNNDGDMPIHLAAGAGHINAVQWLLKNGKAGVNAKGQSGRTPMHQAAIQNRVEIIKYLKGQGADLYAEDDGNFSPMAAAARARDDCSESIRCLKNLGVCVNRPCSDTWTPIFGAAMTTQIANIKCLKDLGADIEAKDSEGKTPIFWAVEAGQIEALKFLVEKAKADICATDNYGLAPIFYAAVHGQDEIIRCLCHDFNVCVDTVADNGITPIFAAASTGQSGTIDTLLNLGAKANRTAKDGRYPADYAKEGGYPEIAKHLQERAAIE